jgi:Zn-dependent protease with chaperone function
MDFFASQDLAHRKTKWLIGYFVLAVLGIIATLHVLAALAFHESLTDWRLLGMISVGVIAVVALGAAYRIAELSQGGRVVAEMLGGRQVAPHTTDLREQQFRNVVEEMALASGVPVPDIYVLDEETAINAFAAGNTPGDAVVAVTRGTLEQLTRDELQGVVGHEFSHILNGDMRLNQRLIGVLTGILLLAILGEILFRMGAWGGGGVRSSDRDGKNNAVPLFAIGAALWLVGSVGVFFAKLIKAAVSRQREFLADASAVQFTRNPDGIAGALWKIGKEGSRLQTARAGEASHLFFGNGLGESFIGLFATHPPIDERIRAIDPGFDPANISKSTPPPLPTQKSDAKIPGLAAAGVALAAMPEFAKAEARETAGATALIYALLLSDDEATRGRQLAALTISAAERAEIERDLQRRGEIGDAIAVMDLSLPALRQLSQQQYTVFRENVRKLIACDGQVDLFEFVLHKALVRHVDHFFTKSRGPAVRVRGIEPLRAEVATVLSALAWQAGDDDATRDAAFQAGANGLGAMTRANGCNFAALDTALDRIAEADIPTKRRVLTACSQAARHDGVIRPREAALLRAISDVLTCPQLDPENVV